MKYLFVFLATGILSASCQHSASGNAALEKSIANVIEAFKNKDAKTINAMIHKDYGLTIIFRTGVFDEYKTIPGIDFDNPLLKNWPYPVAASGSDIKYETLPVFDCESESWSKQGLYCDLTQRDDLLSRTVYNLEKYAEIPAPPGVIEKFKEIEGKSHRIVLIDNDDKALIFYL
ncbi:MAG: hypothetical protein KDD04_03285, partial [Sinomicrobium sp.]|nr:hypothetical protein [Sinomicrobium sp.]